MGRVTEVRLKTVFDATRPDPTGLLTAQLRLHVASWRSHAPAARGLTVTCISAPPAELTGWLTEIGADVEIVPGPHRLVERSPTYNKHLAGAHAADERVFLSDNDTVYLHDITPLHDVADVMVAASLADNRRVEPSLWEELRAEAATDVIDLDWVPWKERALAQVEERAPQPERYAYFNSGAILFPPGSAFWDVWEGETERLSAHLARRGLDDRKDAGSDQLSLTSAAARHGAWQLLPPGYNVRPFHFWVRDLDLERVDHLHMVATGRALRRLSRRDQGSLTALLHKYWELMVLEHVAPAKRALADSALEAVVALVAEYELDEVSPTRV